MMEAVAEDQGPLDASKEPGLEDDTASAIQDEDFDFDIDGPGDNLEETMAGLEPTHDGVAYHIEHNEAPHDAPTHPMQGHGAQEAVGESQAEDIPGQDHGQLAPELSVFDTSIGAEAVNQADPFDDEQHGHTEREEAPQADAARYGEGEQYQEDVYLEATAEELGDLIGADHQNEELAQEAMAATDSVEFEQLEDEHLHDDIHDEGISAEEIGVTQTGGETQPPANSNNIDVTAENGTKVAEPHSDEVVQNTSLEHGACPADSAARQNNTDAAYDLDDASGQEMESSPGSEQHHRVRVSYGTAEFYLFAESPDADPDDYFFENADILSQPLSQFLSKLRQVITEDLKDLDELFVKVDGLGIEFGEATTKDFLEHTTFGQVLDLYDRLVKLDDDSFEAPELYIYLETRPNCLRRLTELAKTADEGKGLSQVAFYYEGTPDFAAIEEASIEYDEGRQGVNSDDISDNGSNDQVEEGLGATKETGPPHNPFRLSESQQQAMDASNSGLAEEAVVDDLVSADADDGHATYGDENNESFSGEMQEHLGLTVTEASRDVSATGVQHNPDLLPSEDEDLATELANDESEAQHYVEEDLPIGEEVAETGTNAEAENEDFQDDDGPTDDHTHAMVESEVKSRDPHRQLVEDALTDVHQALVATADWSSRFSSTINARDSLVANFNHSNYIEKLPADFNVQDYDTAENDDYLDIGATEEEAAEPAEYEASIGTPEPTSHDSSATATLDGEGQGHDDDVSAPEAMADAGHPAQTQSQLEPGPPETQTDEIHWNDDDDDEHNNDSDEVDITNQNQADLSPSSLSVKRGRQADEDDVGLGDDSIAKRRRT